MADIDMQKKQGGMGWIGWVVGLLVLLLLVWWMWPDDETDEFAVVDPVVQVTPAAEMPATPTDGMEALATTEILANPASYVGTTVSGVAEVVEVPTDRGFWLDAGNGERLLVILDEMGDEVPIHVQQGQRMRLENARVRGGDEIDQVSGNLNDATRSLLQQETVFLTIDDAGVTLHPLSGDQPGAGMAGDTMAGGS